MKNFKSVEWLNKNIDLENLIIFDCREVFTENDIYKSVYYSSAHIKNAVFVKQYLNLSSKVKEHGGRTPMVDVNDFKSQLEAVGVNNNSIIVIYDDKEMNLAGRLWWMLKYLGLENVYVLLGGYNSWIEGNYPVEKTARKIFKSMQPLTINIQHDILVDVNYVKENSDAVLIDTRSKIRYLGIEELVDKVAGHIPGAINMPWTELNSLTNVDKTFLNNYFKNLDKNKENIVYCGSGITATVNYLFMDELNFNVKLYLGSFSDYISYSENKVN